MLSKEITNKLNELNIKNYFEKETLDGWKEHIEKNREELKVEWEIEEDFNKEVDLELKVKSYLDLIFDGVLFVNLSGFKERLSIEIQHDEYILIVTKEKEYVFYKEHLEVVVRFIVEENQKLKTI